MKLSSWVKHRNLQLSSDAKNILHFGSQAPRYAERLFFTPSAGMPVMRGGARHGQIISEWSAGSPNVVGDISPIKEVLLHFKNGYSWAETGLYERMEKKLAQIGYVDGCISMADVYRRYQKLDIIYQEAKELGRLKTQAEVDLLSMREFGGIVLHIDSGGGLVFSRIGQHRMAIALALRISEVPFSLGAVHYSVAKNFAPIRKRYQARG